MHSLVLVLHRLPCEGGLTSNCQNMPIQMADDDSFCKICNATRARNKITVICYMHFDINKITVICYMHFDINKGQQSDLWVFLAVFFSIKALLFRVKFTFASVSKMYCTLYIHLYLPHDGNTLLL